MTGAPLKVEFICYPVGKRLPKSDKPLWYYFPHKKRWIMCHQIERSNGEWCLISYWWIDPVEAGGGRRYAIEGPPTFYAYHIPEPSLADGVVND